MQVQRISWLVLICSLIFSCRGKVEERSDELYSRHLQKKISLKVWNTPVPDEKSSFHLLLLTNAAEFQHLQIKDLLRGLIKEKQIQPMVIVAIKDDKKYFGINGDGKSAPKNREAEKYDNFIVNELLAHIKKQSGVRKFKTVAVAGAARSADNALDLGWNHADKINLAAAFAPDYEIANDTSMIFKMIKASRKRPKTGFWFDVPRPGNPDADPTTDLTDLIRQKVNAEIGINEDGRIEASAFTDFLQWAYRP